MDAALQCDQLASEYEASTAERLVGWVLGGSPLAVLCAAQSKALSLAGVVVPTAETQLIAPFLPSSRMARIGDALRYRGDRLAMGALVDVLPGHVRHL